MPKRLHGMWRTAEFAVWQKMIRRCYDERGHNYRYYGGRGILVCGGWRDSFLAFYGDVGPRPSSKHRIERIDNDGNYEPGNVRWATLSEQARNRRSTIILEHKGVRHCLKEWSDLIGIRLGTLQYRFHKGWTVDRILCEPLNRQTK